jgi:hypothetical protein
MNKASLLPHHALIYVFLVCIICTLLGSVSIQSVKADAAPPPDPTVGGVGPYQPQKTNVQMMAETVFIDVPQSPSNVQEPKQIRVNAEFTMRNQGKTEEQMQVIFPLTRLNTWQTEQALYKIDVPSFAVKVNGQSVPFTSITTPPEVTATDTEHGFMPEVQWAAFEVSFPVQKDVMLQVEYEMLNPYEYEVFTGIAYILETGAGWYGNILSAEIIVRLPYQMEEAALYYAKPGYVISGKELHWTLKDFEPTRDDNLDVRVVEAEWWQAIVGMRSQVKQNPKDADAWNKLANGYESLAIFYTIGGQKENGFSYSLNHRTSDLAVEARRKVVELRPNWGDAHFWLAEILWYTNPTVEKIWGEWTGTLGSIQPNDPSIQEVLHELELAWSYGLSENMSWDEEYLVEMINRTVPGLELAPPGAPTVTVTMATPTETLAPTATNTPLPTVSPTIVPTASNTPISTEMPSNSRNNVLLIVALGLIITSGIFVFRLKSK